LGTLNPLIHGHATIYPCLVLISRIRKKEIAAFCHRAKSINVDGGMVEEYCGSGGPGIQFSWIRKSGRNGQHARAEIVQVSPDKGRMLRGLSSVGITFPK
jgi:hypothetical protein